MSSIIDVVVFQIKVNNTAVSTMSIGGINLSESIVSVGSMINESNIHVHHLNGNLELLCYSSNPVRNGVLNDIYNQGSLINIRSVYDDDGRLKEKTIESKETSLKTRYRYYEENNKINMVPTSEVSHLGEETIYSYDELNNFKEGFSYEYDELKRSGKESRYKENNVFDYSYTYTYDSNVNILTKSRVDEDHEPLYTDYYIYSSEIKDRLISIKRNLTEEIYKVQYEGENAFYPSSIMVNNQSQDLIWEGRRLKQYGDISYQYDENGIRKSKNTGGSSYNYIIEGNPIIRVTSASASKTVIIDYHYDEKGQVCGLAFNGEVYFYTRDITGNINNIIDSKGAVIVEYKYTAFGVPSKAIGTSLTSEQQDAAQNLNISYLDPESINGLNLFAYCYNNQVMHNDPIDWG